MTPDGAIDHDGIRHNVDYIIESKVDGVGFGFSEPWYLTLRERMDAFETFVKAERNKWGSIIKSAGISVD